MAGARTIKRITLAFGIGLAASSSALANVTVARPAAGCIVAALNQQSRVVPESDFYKSMDEVAAYWRAHLDRSEPDPAQREALLRGAEVALDKDLSKVARMEGMMLVGQVLAGCRKQREILGG
jgi:hypothetical protein